MGFFDRFRKGKFRKEFRENKPKKYTISREVLEMAIAASRDSHPHEFIALLAGKKTHISELVLLPSISGNASALIHFDMLPLGMRILGTVHSHPSPFPYPSEQDLETFSKRGSIHIIIAYPYTMDSWRAFDRGGKEIMIEIIE